MYTAYAYEIVSGFFGSEWGKYLHIHVYPVYVTYMMWWVCAFLKFTLSWRLVSFCPKVFINETACLAEHSKLF